MYIQTQTITGIPVFVAADRESLRGLVADIKSRGERYRIHRRTLSIANCSAEIFVLTVARKVRP